MEYSNISRPYQIWNQAKPDARFPRDYKRGSVVEAGSLLEAASKGKMQDNDVIVDSTHIAHRFEGAGQFSAIQIYRNYEKYTEYRELTWEQDQAFAAAVLGIDAPTRDQVVQAISMQQMVSMGEQEDRAIMDAGDHYIEWMLEGDYEESNDAIEQDMVYDPEAHPRQSKERDGRGR